MIPKITRGRSFKKLTAYLMHDKREGWAEAGDPHPDTAERVGFTRTMNFIGDAAQDDPRIAARMMVATWKSREAIKQAAGSRPGGPPAARIINRWLRPVTVPALHRCRGAQPVRSRRLR